MNAFNNFLSNPWAHALGWTLIHSLWQSLIILLLVEATLYLIPTVRSKARYLITCGAFLLTFLASTLTFSYLLSQTLSSITPSPYAHTLINHGPAEAGSIYAIEQTFFSFIRVIESNMPFIIIAWAFGFIIFALRLFTGFFYTYQLRTSAIPLNNEWRAYINQLSEKLRIERHIRLAESAQISSPIVLGYMKPLILVPVGMLTGLSPEQLETIFLHEVAHIKRHDYLINLIQSFIETIFFFNPFVWRLSGLIRTEREYCCDDLVISQHGSSHAYAHALAHLEEVRLSQNMFALSLADNKNQLLNRIKRIMEKSVKNYSGKDRLMIPAIILIAGLFCGSWLSIHQENGYTVDKRLNAQDTTIRKNVKSARYSRKRVTTLDKNGQPHEEITENFEGDEALRPLVENAEPSEPNLLMPPPPLSSDPLIAPGYLDVPDSIPGRTDPRFEEFSKTFEDRFRERFEDFYSSHETDLQEIMKEMETQFQSQDWPALSGSLENFSLSEMDLERAQQAQEEALKRIQDVNVGEALQNFQEMNENLQEQMESFKNFNTDRNGEPGNLNRYEQALKEQLTKDGYLSQDETIISMEWNNDVIKVNGKKIKDSDRKKYEALHDKYVTRLQHAGKVE